MCGGRRPIDARRDWAVANPLIRHPAEVQTDAIVARRAWLQQSYVRRARCSWRRCKNSAVIQPPPACILCGVPPPRTGEHLWPDWYDRQQPADYTYELESIIQDGEPQYTPRTSLI